MDRRVTSHAAGAPGAHPKTSSRSTCVRTRRRVEISLSWSSHAVRFLPFSHNSGIHRLRRLPTRRNSNPRNPKLSPCCRSTLRLLSSFTSTGRLVNSSRSRLFGSASRLPPYTLPSSQGDHCRESVSAATTRPIPGAESLPTPFDTTVKFTLMLLSRFFPWERTLAIVKSSTLVRWHRAGFSTVQAM